MRGQIGPRAFITWFIALIIVAGFMPTYLNFLNLQLPSFDAGSPEKFLWGLTPFVIVAALAGSLLSAAFPNREPPPRYY